MTPAKDSAKKPTGPAHDLERGIQTFSVMFSRWMDSNGWTHPKITTLAKAANGGLAWLHSSQISGLRHGSLTNAGPRTFASIAALNLAIYNYQHQSKLIPGTTSSEDYEHASAITDEHGEPPSPGWWLEVFLGVRKPVGLDLDSDWYTAAQAQKLSRSWAILTRKLIAESGEDLVLSIDRILAVGYPATERERKSKVKEVLFNQSSWSPDEIRTEMPAIAALVKSLGGPETAEEMKELIEQD